MPCQELKYLNDSNPVEKSEYPIDQEIDHELVFN